ncbi:MAG: hypothetical protein LUQ69_09370 [Methanoregulaceae archaeon]|nr:hypothetical protein [Methanoregulaceae archaeon]
MRLWIEAAYQSLVRAGVETGRDAVCTFQTEEQFFAVVVSESQGAGRGARADLIAEETASLLEQGVPLSTVVEATLKALPEGEHVPFSILQVRPSAGSLQPSAFLEARLVECDAPPLFMTRGGELVLLPVVEEEVRGRLIRQCEFSLQDGDYLAMVSEGYVCAKGWDQCWGWRDIATAVKRLTDTRCDAEQLLGALIRSYRRLAGVQSETLNPREASEISVSVVALFVRPMRTATVWSGPPTRRDLEEVMLNKLTDETGARAICGDTTAEIAARLLGAKIEMEPRPENGWAEVPPTSRLAGMDLVTEGVVTMGKARGRIAEAKRAKDLPRKEDGATRLARLLLNADKIHFLVGLAVNPAQTADLPDGAGKVPLRKIVVEDLMRDLKARGKVIAVEYF